LPTAGPLRVLAAGSLKGALRDVAVAFERAHGRQVEGVFGASGTLRARIEAGEPADLFASADLGHPTRLAAAGRGGPVALFARNVLCALAQPWVEATPGELLDVLLDPAVRVGTSTPGFDPSGDHALAIFGKAGRLRPGAEEVLAGKVLRLTGAPDWAKAPGGRNLYAWAMAEGRTDVFLTYRTNALVARAEMPWLRLIELPRELAVRAEYGLVVLAGAPADAATLALFILGLESQSILARHGFHAPHALGPER
jgi:molybdate transport system substrate-binding protein